MKKPRCCPDPDCDMLFVTRHNPKDVGDSFDCYGKIPEMIFSWNGNEHKNDISHCTYTPLKGMIRFLENKDDQDLMIARILKLLAMLGLREFNMNWYFHEAYGLPEIDGFEINDKVVKLNDQPPHLGQS